MQSFNFHGRDFDKNHEKKEEQLKKIQGCKTIFVDFLNRAFNDERFWKQSNSWYFNPDIEIGKLPSVIIADWRVSVQYDVYSESEWWDMKRIIISNPKQETQLVVEFNVLKNAIYLDNNEKPLISLDPKFGLWFMPEHSYEESRNISEIEQASILSKIIEITEKLKDFFAKEKNIEKERSAGEALQKKSQIQQSITKLVNM